MGDIVWNGVGHSLSNTSKIFQTGAMDVERTVSASARTTCFAMAEIWIPALLQGQRLSRLEGGPKATPMITEEIPKILPQNFVSRGFGVGFERIEQFVAAKEPMTAQLVTREQSFLNILVERSQGDAQERRRLLRIHESLILKTPFFFPRSRDLLF